VHHSASDKNISIWACLSVSHYCFPVFCTETHHSPTEVQQDTTSKKIQSFGQSCTTAVVSGV
jgi:hypothetical protein